MTTRRVEAITGLRNLYYSKYINVLDKNKDLKFWNRSENFTRRVINASDDYRTNLQLLLQHMQQCNTVIQTGKFSSFNLISLSVLD